MRTNGLYDFNGYAERQARRRRQIQRVAFFFLAIAVAATVAAAIFVQVSRP